MDDMRPVYMDSIELENQDLRRAPDPVGRGIDQAMYERQIPLNLRHPSVMLVGCGGVGCWVALSLVLGGVEKLTLFDGDTLSVHNLNRFPLPESSVGEGKSLALSKWLRTLRPNMEIQARGEFDSLLHLSTSSHWLVCATDSLKSRRMCFAFAKSMGMSYLEVGADGEKWTLSPAPPEFSTELEDTPGYQTVPVHVGPCMMAGAAVAYYVLHEVIPVDSHQAGWDGQRIVISTMAEEEGPFVYCPRCKTFRVTLDGGYSIMTMIKHARLEFNIGLAEAKAMVNGWFREVRDSISVTDEAMVNIDSMEAITALRLAEALTEVDDGLGGNDEP